MKKILNSCYINDILVEVCHSTVFELKVENKLITVSNSIDNIHGDLFECLMTYFEDLSVFSVNKLFYEVYLFIDIVKQEFNKGGRAKCSHNWVGKSENRYCNKCGEYD